jgi:hypothetical protein
MYHHVCITWIDLNECKLFVLTLELYIKWYTFDNYYMQKIGIELCTRDFIVPNNITCL